MSVGAIHVDRDRCERLGQCVFAAPDVFRFDDDGELDYDATPAPGTEGDVDEAISTCPMQAISRT